MINCFIDKLQSFNSLQESAVAALAKATAKPTECVARKDLIREGDRAGPTFVMLDGWACRYKILPNGARQILAYLMPGDCCDLRIGLSAKMDHSIQTITPALICTISQAKMDGIMKNHPDVGKAMYLAQLVDEATTRAWITSMGRRTSIERVAQLMCELYLRARNIGLTSERSFSLPISQLMLADSLGMTQVHLNRVLKELRLKGTISLQRGSLQLIDPEKLINIAGFDESYLRRRLRKAA